MRFLLFNPWIYDFSAFDHWARPLNLLRLATLLRQCGCEIDFYDCLDRRSPDLKGLPKPPRHRLNSFGCGHYYREHIPSPEILKFIPRHYKRYGVPPERVEQHLRRFQQPDVVVISTLMTYWYPGVFDAIKMMRRLFPKAKIIIGGIYATLCHDHAERYAKADAVIVGSHWPEIVNRIFDTAGYIGSRCEGNQSTWIDPAYDLIQADSCFPILTSTGCPCHCTYCATHELWPKYVQYEPEKVLESVDLIAHRYKVADIAFYDDALLSKKQTHFIPLMETIISRGYSLRFHTPNALHVRQIDSHVACLLYQAGFKTIRLGLEVVQRDWQKSTGGKVYTNEYIQAMEFLRNAGFTAQEIGTYIMYGFPGQSIEAVWEAVQFVAQQGSEIKLALYSPIPQTPMFKTKTDDFIFDPTLDPLLQNSSLAPWRSHSIPDESYRELQQFAVSLNQKSRKPLPKGDQMAI